MLSRRLFVVIFVLSLVTRLGMLAIYGPDTSSNSSEYTQIAENIVTRGAIVEQDTFTGEWHPYTFRMPGYQLFVAAIYALVGINDTAHYIVVILQILFASTIAVIVAHIGTKLFSRQIGVLAGFLSALDPWLSYHSLTILNDNLFAFTLTLSFLVGMIALQRRSFKWALLWGLSIGLSLLVRPVIKYYFLVAAFTLALSPIRWRDKVRLCAACFLGISVLLGGWLLRNRLQTGYWVIETNQGMSMLWRTADLVRESTPEDYEWDARLAQARDIAAATEPSGGGTVFANIRREMAVSEIEANDYMVRLAFETMLQSPLEYGGRGLRHAANFVSGTATLLGWGEKLGLPSKSSLTVAENFAEGQYGYAIYNLVLRSLSVLVFGVLFVVGFVQSWRALPKIRVVSTFFLLSFLYTMLAVSLILGQDRYRLPLHAIVWIFVSYALASVHASWRTGRCFTTHSPVTPADEASL